MLGAQSVKSVSPKSAFFNLTTHIVGRFAQIKHVHKSLFSVVDASYAQSREAGDLDNQPGVRQCQLSSQPDGCRLLFW